MPRVIIATERGETVHEINVAADDLRTPIARANFFIDLNTALKLAEHSEREANDESHSNG